MSIDILNKKGTTPVIIILLVSTLGLGGTNLINDNTDNTSNDLLIHVAAESPHIGTKTELHMIKDNLTEFKEITTNDLTELKQMIKENNKLIQKLYIMICTYNGYDCFD